MPKWSRWMLIAGFGLMPGHGPRAPYPARSVAHGLPAGTSKATMSVSGCSFTVTYTWSGFTGKNLIASFGIYVRKGTLDESLLLENTEGQDGKGGSVSHTFTLAPNVYPAGRILLGRGALVNSRKYSDVSGTTAASGAISSTCG